MAAALDSGDNSIEAIGAQIEAAEAKARQPVKASAPNPPAEPVEEPAEEEAPEGEPDADGPAEEPAEGEEPASDDAAVEGQRFKVQVDGQEQEVPVDELISGYLRQSDYTKKTQAVAAERTQYQTERKQFAVEKQAVADRLGPLIQQAVQSLEGEDAQAWAELRQTDPGAYAAKVIERQQRIEATRQLQLEQQQLYAQSRAERVPQERDALATANEAFRKDFSATYKSVGEYVLAQGFTPAEWNEVVDHRQVLLCWKAQQYDKLATKTAPEVKKQLAALPKVVRPGQAKPAGQVKAERQRAIREDAFKSGRVEDIAAYLEKAHPITG